MEQIRILSLLQIWLILHISSVLNSQAVLNGEITFYQLSYRDSANYNHNFYYCSDGAEYYPCDFLAFENSNASYSSNSKVFASSILLGEEVSRTLEESHKIWIYTRPPIYEIKFEISLRMVTYKCQYEVARFSEYIPVPYERKLNLNFNITPISLNEKIDRVDQHFVEYLSRYYYDLLGFIQSEYMFFYDLR
ncbi:MAG: hypothetical protein ACK4WD_05165 [Flavobacteriales bacterium]|jgi:hypothetical protein